MTSRRATPSGCDTRLQELLVGSGADAPAWRLVSRAGDRDTAYALALTRAAFPAGSGARRWWPLLAVAGTDLSQELIKRAVDRARPPRSGWRVTPHGASFPSRHTALAAAAAGGWGAPGQALVALVGLSRVRLGVHWPGDVAGGWLLGAAWACWAQRGTPTSRRLADGE